MGALVFSGCGSIPAADAVHTNASLTAPSATQERSTPSDNLLRIASQIEERGSIATALPLYERAATSPDADAPVYSRLADAYTKLGRYAEAEKTYRTALVKRADYGPALLGLGGILIGTGRAKEGLATLKQAAPLVNQPSAYDRLGVAHMAMGEPLEALASFEQAHSMAPGDTDIATNLALAAALSGDFDKAAGLAKEIAKAPDLKDYHRRNLVLIQAIAGRDEDARLAGHSLNSATVEQILDQARDIGSIASPKERAIALGTINTKTVTAR